MNSKINIIGIIGGGQLGRMSALAAANLGYKTHIYSDHEDSPASHVAYKTTIGSFDNEKLLAEFASQVDVVSFEFENIPAEVLKSLEKKFVLSPSAKILEICRNRVREKSFVNDIGVQTAKFHHITSREQLKANYADSMALLKTCELGYDGKGQFLLRNKKDIDDLDESLFNLQPGLILEELIDFAYEISIIVARNKSGKTQCFPVSRNKHESGILRLSEVPYEISLATNTTNNIERKAAEIAIKIAIELDLQGLLAIEFFVTKDGKLLLNEMAPRPHNSGHWTMDGCITSQFEQYIRAICNLPLGATELTCKKVEMHNLLGDEINNALDYLKNPYAKLHLYDKNEAKTGRKMGHVNIIAI